jgi:single-strand DNA-binding protein
MKLIGLIRLGRDAEMAYTGSGMPVAKLACAWNYGRKDADGKRPVQWANLSFFGERAEKLQQWLVKGAQFMIVADDVAVETYTKRDGSTGVSLVGIVNDLEFAGGGQQQGAQQSAPAPRPAPPPVQRQAPAARPAGGGGASGFDDLDDDSIPF